MNFLAAVRSCNQHGTHYSPNICSRRWFRNAILSWFKGTSEIERLKSSVKVGGKTIKYIRRGEGEHAVLCLPGALGSSLTDFKAQIEGLDQNAFTIIAWDPPGYGHSRPPNRDFSPGFLKRDADYAVDFMKAIDIPKFSVLGWSDGGITGIFLAAKYPENLRKMAIWGASAYITDEDAEVHKKIRDLSIWSERMKAPMVELYGKDGFRTMWEQWVDELLRIHREDGGDICKSELKSIQCPLFVLHGRNDPLVLHEHPQYIIENVPGSQLYTFEDGKHNIHVRCAEEFNSLVHKFLTTDQIPIVPKVNVKREGVASRSLKSTALSPDDFLKKDGTTEQSPYRLPPLRPENPALWFAQIEAQFQLSHIYDDLTKFNCVVSQLDAKYAVLVEDVICDPPAQRKYNLLRTELIKRLDRIPPKRSSFKVEIERQTPSDFLYHLRELGGSSVSESLLRSFWLGGLPKQVQSVVTTQSAPLDALAGLADKVAEMQPVSTDMSSIKTVRTVISKELSSLTQTSPEAHSQKADSRYKRRADVYGTKVKYDVTGFPIPGSSPPIDLRQQILGNDVSSNYHLLLSEFPGIMHPSGVPQEVNLRTRHRILTKPSSAVSTGPFASSTHEMNVTRSIIDSMIRVGTARPSSSPHGSPLKLVKHSYGWDLPGWHAFGDYRVLNSNTLSDTTRTRYPVEVSDSLWGCNVFSVVFLREDWTRVRMAPEDIAKTAVATPFGKIEFPFMPQGLRNSTKTRQKVLDEVLQGLPCCFGYLHGILVFSRNHEEHLQHIRALFQRLSVNGMYVNPSTSVFGKPTVTFFNYTISSSGCSWATEKLVRSLENIRFPKTYAEVKLFLNMNREYRRYIPASVEGPLRGVVETSNKNLESPVPWTSGLEKAFEDCKSALTRATLNTQPDPFAPLSISISVNGSVMGAVLNQKTRNNTVPLAFFSKSLLRNSSIALFAYLSAMYLSLEAFLPLVGGRDFTVFLDDESSVRVLEIDHFIDRKDCYMASYCSQYITDVEYASAGDRPTFAAQCLAALIDPSELSDSDSTDSRDKLTQTSRFS